MAVLLGNCTRRVVAGALIKASCPYSVDWDFFYNWTGKGKLSQRSSASIICYFFFTTAIQSVCFERFTAKSLRINEALVQSSHVDMRGNDSLCKLYVSNERGLSSDSVITLIRTPSAPKHAIRAYGYRK